MPCDTAAPVENVDVSLGRNLAAQFGFRARAIDKGDVCKVRICSAPAA